MELKAPKNLLDILDSEIIDSLDSDCTAEVSFEHPDVEGETRVSYFLWINETKLHSDRAAMPGEKPKYLTVCARGREDVHRLREEFIPACREQGYELGTGLMQQCSIVLSNYDQWYGGHKPVVLASREKVCLALHPWVALSEEAIAVVERTCSFDS